MPRKSAAKRASKAAGKRLALLICNGTFEQMPSQNLKGPAKDATLIGSVLRDPEVCGFEVRELVDGGLREVRLEIARVCKAADERDTLLIYYSGHGLIDADGTFHIAVTDTHGDYPEATGLDSDFFLARLRRSRCRKFVLIVDAAHSGAFFNGNSGIPDGLYAITACSAVQTAVDAWAGGEFCGAFTAALTAGLRASAADTDGDGRVSIDELHEFVKQWLADNGYEQTPQKWVWNVPEPIYLTPKLRPVFLSYSRKNIEAADKLKGALEHEGLSVWLDRQDSRSGNWEDRITEGLNRSRALVLLFSEQSLDSPMVRKELDFAEAKRVSIIPVELDESSAQKLPDWFLLKYDKLQRYRLGGDEGYEGRVKAIADAIRRLRKVQRGSKSNDVRR